MNRRWWRIGRRRWCQRWGIRGACRGSGCGNRGWRSRGVAGDGAAGDADAGTVNVVEVAADGGAGVEDGVAAGEGGHHGGDFGVGGVGGADGAFGADDLALGGDGVIEDGGGVGLAGEVHADGAGGGVVAVAAVDFDDDFTGPVGDGGAEGGEAGGIEGDVAAVAGDGDGVAGAGDGLAVEVGGGVELGLEVLKEVVDDLGGRGGRGDVDAGELVAHEVEAGFGGQQGVGDALVVGGQLRTGGGGGVHADGHGGKEARYNMARTEAMARRRGWRSRFIANLPCAAESIPGGEAESVQAAHDLAVVNDGNGDADGVGGGIDDAEGEVVRADGLDGDGLGPPGMDWAMGWPRLSMGGEKVLPARVRTLS